VGISGIVVLAGLALVASATGIYALARARRMRGFRKRYGDAAMPQPQGFAWRTVAPAVLLVGAGASIVMAFGGVRLNHQATQGTVILAVDVSRSMDKTDVAPDRLEAAQAAAQSFLRRLPAGFQVGVVTFAGTAQVLVAPTADHTQLAGALGTLSTSNGTVIGDGLSTALDTIDAERRARGVEPAAVVLLTDGQDTGSTISPDQAAQRAKADNVKVFTVAVGATDTGTSGANTGLLAQIATTTGARAFTAASASQLTDVYQSLGSELSTDLAIAGSGTRFVVLAAALAIAAGISLVVLTREL
jgi:Ca-activated chloride channel family protein